MSEPARDERQWTLRWGRVGGRVVLAEGNAIGDDEKVEVFPKSRLAAVEAERDIEKRRAEMERDAANAFRDEAEAAERRVQELEAENEKLKRAALSEAYTDEGVEVVLNDLKATKQRVQELEAERDDNLAKLEAARDLIESHNGRIKSYQARVQELESALREPPSDAEVEAAARALFDKETAFNEARFDYDKMSARQQQIYTVKARVALIAARSVLSEPSSR